MNLSTYYFPFTNRTSPIEVLICYSYIIRAVAIKITHPRYIAEIVILISI